MSGSAPPDGNMIGLKFKKACNWKKNRGEYAQVD
jgi:hypothetical protein